MQIEYTNTLTALNVYKTIRFVFSDFTQNCYVDFHLSMSTWSLKFISTNDVIKFRWTKLNNCSLEHPKSLFFHFYFFFWKINGTIWYGQHHQVVLSHRRSATQKICRWMFFRRNANLLSAEDTLIFLLGNIYKEKLLSNHCRRATYRYPSV